MSVCVAQESVTMKIVAVLAMWSIRLGRVLYGSVVAQKRSTSYHKQA